MADTDVFARMEKTLSELGHPEQGFRAIHIAGTNGKGSTAVMAASILEEAGYKVGLYTSPHLELETERIRILDGEDRMIPQDRLDELMREARAAVGRADPGYTPLFMVYTLAAFMYFAEEKPDYVVLECGIGGRRDVTNTVGNPVVSVFTQIGLDHTDTLGNTIFRITREKAGIIRPGVPVVCQPSELSIRNIIRRTAEENGCSFTDVYPLAGKYRKYELAMTGEHQLMNAATAAEAVRAAGIPVTEEAVASGLRKAVNPGRFEIISKDPYVIIDGSHNPDAVRALCETYSRFAQEKKIRRTYVIVGCMKDKNSGQMVRILTESLRGATFAAAAIDYDRAEDPETIGGYFADAGRSCVCYDDLQEAFEDILSSNYESILITGSIYLAGAMRSMFKNQYLHN